nr:MAG TPA: hypothetical protein [Caudoviricetes sp.]
MGERTAYKDYIYLVKLIIYLLLNWRHSAAGKPINIIV